jgi:transposase-like protein
VPLDEKWSCVAKKQKHCQPHDIRPGDCWDHGALDAQSRLVLSVVVGKRTEAHATQVVHAMRERTDGRPLNLITTEEYPAYASALAAVYAEPASAGEAVPEAQRLPDWLVYATVHKVRENNRVVKVEARLVYGTLLSRAARQRR